MKSPDELRIKILEGENKKLKEIIQQLKELVKFTETSAAKLTPTVKN